MEELYEIAFGLILHAGNSRSLSIQGAEKAGKGCFEEAEQLLKEADKELHEAHQIQTTLLQTEADGKASEINLLMVHAQDHIAMAMTQKEMTRQLIQVYKKIEEVKISC